ncbi:MAG: hypothetical protein QF733_00490 [Phycisphaerales bacterium]|jgi:hypothetical protein|nr:hypothetical protein [Phycisphaerales bacterium]
MRRYRAALKWVGRGVGACYVAFFLFFLVAHLMGDEPSGLQPLSGSEVAMFVAIGVTIAGVLVSFWKAGAGGWCALAGWMALVGIDWPVVFNPYFGMAAVAGVLLILGSWGAPARACRE